MKAVIKIALPLIILAVSLDANAQLGLGVTSRTAVKATTSVPSTEKLTSSVRSKASSVSEKTKEKARSTAKRAKSAASQTDASVSLSSSSNVDAGSDGLSSEGDLNAETGIVAPFERKKKKERIRNKAKKSKKKFKPIRSSTSVESSQTINGSIGQF